MLTGIGNCTLDQTLIVNGSMHPKPRHVSTRAEMASAVSGLAEKAFEEDAEK